VGEVLQAADKAEDAVGHMPVIGENGNWFAWNADKTSYEDTGNPSQGEPGEDGKAATVLVGTVTTLPAGSRATVTNSGTETEAVLNFGIPRGEAGTGGDGASSEDLEALNNRLDNHANAIETLQNAQDNFEVWMFSRTVNGWPVVSPNGTLYAIFVNDDGTLRVGEYIEE
jgi:hypothetical protein